MKVTYYLDIMKKKIFVIVITIFLVVIIGFSIFYKNIFIGGTHLNINQWAEFKSETYGFQLKYPQDFFIKTETSFDGIDVLVGDFKNIRPQPYAPADGVFIAKDANFAEPFPFGASPLTGSVMSVYVVKYPYNHEWVNKSYNSVPEKKGMQITTENIDGRNFSIVRTYDSRSCLNFQNYAVFTSLNDKTLYIKFGLCGEDKSFVEKILSTVTQL